MAAPTTAYAGITLSHEKEESLREAQNSPC